MKNREKLLERSLRESAALSKLLSGDTLLSGRLLHEHWECLEAGEIDFWEASFWVKSCIRTFLAHIDAIGYMMRRDVVRYASMTGLEIPKKKLAEVAERRFDRLTDEMTDEPARRLGPREGLKLGYRYYPKLFGSDFALDLSDDRWQSLGLVVEDRNAFAHPKTLDDLIPLKAIVALRPAMLWFFETQVRLVQCCGAAVGAPTQELEPPTWKRFSAGDLVAFERLSESELATVRRGMGNSLTYAQYFLLKPVAEIDLAMGLCRSSPYLRGATVHPRAQFAYRNLIRTLYSTIEAMTSAAAFFVEAAASRGEVELSAGQRAVLERTGCPEEQFVAILNLWSSTVGTGTQLVSSGRDWKAFLSVGRDRDRITHPRSADSIKIRKPTIDRSLAAAGFLIRAMEVLSLDVDALVERGRAAGTIIS